MSVDLPNFRKGVYTWIVRELEGTEVTPDRVFWVEPNAPRPPRPCVGLDLITGPVQTAHDQRRETAPGIWKVSGQRRVTISVIAYGEDADTIIGRLHSGVELETVREVFRAYGMGLVRQEDVLDVSQLLDTKFEKRSQFDVTFHVVSERTEDVGYIETVEIENEDTGTTTEVGP